MWRDLMEKLLRVASPLGLFAEEFDVDTDRHLGNFPSDFGTRAERPPRGARLPPGTRDVSAGQPSSG
jgi:hypothetical protein